MKHPTNFLLISLIVLQTLFSAITSQKCLILALQGGGDHGAYQAGALKGLAYNLPEEDSKWEIITGISAGTLNGAGFSLFPHGQEKEAVDFLEKVWREIDSKDKIYKNWKSLGILGPAYALFAETGFYDTTPLRELLTSILSDRDIVRDLHIGINNIETGAYEVVEAKTLTKEELINAILSSSAVPIIFPAIDFKGGLYQDGGVKHGVDILSGVNECKKKGFEEKDIIIDVVKCFNKQFKQKDPTKFKAMDSLLQWFAIWNQDRSDREISDIVKSFPEINFRYIIAPTKELPNTTAPLFFKKEDIEFMFVVGEEDAKNAIKNGRDGSVSVLNEIINAEKLFFTTTKKAVPNVDKLNENDELKFLSN
jgi:predicted patatin/cPLA2 family phospholipase